MKSQGYSHFSRLSDEELKIETKKARDWNNKWNKINSPVTKFNNKGIECEKAGELKKAIVEYNKCLNWIYSHYDGVFMKGIAWHSPDRLRILYKKLKDAKEKEFLQEFTAFCRSKNIIYPSIYDTQLTQTLNNSK